MRLLERHLVEVIALFEGKASLSYNTVIFLAKLAAAELKIPPEKLPRFTREGWCKHFLQRYGYRVRRAHGEVHSVDVAAAERGAAELRQKIAEYDLNDVLNVDEAAYFYKSIARVSVCLGLAPAPKINKARMTFLVGSNATGSEKLRLLVLGKAQKPRWLPQKPESVDYKGTKKGWMTTIVFKDWRLDLNDKMKAAGRKILLLYDNAPVHKEPEDELPNIEIARLPKNTTALLQPMDQGVIAWLKGRILNDRTAAAVLPVLLGVEDPHAIKTGDAIEWLGDAWDAIPEQVLANCWRHTGLLSRRVMCVDHLLN
eukprot:jgi/Phyca11/117126/e_gw1.32.61.1